MAYKFNQRGNSPKQNILFLLFFALGSLLLATLGAQAQTPSPSPTPANEAVTFMGYNVTSSFEFGVRGVSVNGNDNKYRSDFNYRPGFRIFDSSFLLENKEKKSKFVDSLLVTSSGWNADPSGFTRVSIEKVGLYRFDSKVRQVSYFNNLNTHARNGHNADTRQNFGDFDLTLYPLSDKLRIRLGGSFNKNTGTGSFTTRPFSDEFIITSHVNSSGSDFRAGVDTKVLGFNLSVNYGLRSFRDKTFYTTTGNLGFNTTNSGVITNLLRQYPVKGRTQYGIFNIQRTFAKKLDFTARVIYSATNRTFDYLETISGRDNSNNIVDFDNYIISGDSKRPQTRADIGLTYAITKDFRISDTFTFDQFNISGESAFAEAVYSRTAAGATRAPVFTNNFYDRVTGYRRIANLIEADYQVNNNFGFHAGYRYSKRRIREDGFNQPLAPATVLTITRLEDTAENQTNTFIAGLKIKPMKNWVIFADGEKGDADNAFTRLANYKVTNLRLRSRWSFNKFAINISAISKDNDNPSTSTAPPANYPTGDFIANTKSRTFSTYFDWTPNSMFSVSGGYTFQRTISETDIVINTGTLVRGLSQFYMRDHYAFFNVTAQPFKKVLFYASYNHDRDTGQGNLVTTLPLLVTSYPFRLFNMESRIAFRFTKNIEWNLGYQYIGYNETVQPLSVGGPQDYHANLPYTSLRIYFGGGDR
jgi:hypothetical protein